MVKGYQSRWKPRLRVVHTAQSADDTQNERQFGRRLLPHLDDAYRYARYLARDQSAAEDIVQEAFLRALKGYASCRGNEKAWLFAIVRNCCIDWSKAHRSAPPDFTDGERETVVDSETPETQLQRDRDILSIRAAIAGMPEPFREAIVLREIDALSYREIATITDVPIGTVMSRLARARIMLATLFLSRGQKGMSA
jgi:RNA polymerase sigma-70 factor (ECF subfamily)